MKQYTHAWLACQGLAPRLEKIQTLGEVVKERAESKKTEMNFSKIEKEVVLLKAVTELIDSMVNREVLCVSIRDHYGETQFKSMTHQKYFNIILVDFLSRPAKEIIKGKQTYLEAIQYICKDPNFDKNNSVSSLKIAADEFNSWLKEEVKVEIWLPSINLETELPIKRAEFIKICGNISKHNFTKLSVVADDIKEIFKNKNIEIEFDQALLVLDDFYERFHSDILNYLGTTIVEFLNNFRWGIYEYLQPEYMRAMVRDKKDSLKDEYIYPEDINKKFAKDCYWELMNEVRSKPYIPRFNVEEIWKKRY